MSATHLLFLSWCCAIGLLEEYKIRMARILGMLRTPLLPLMFPPRNAHLKT